MTGQDTPPNRPSPTAFAGHRALLLDDNEFNQEMFAGQLSSFGLDVDVASDGLEGLKKFRDNTYSVILTDCRMPNMDGYAFTRAVRSEEQAHGLTPTVILAITGGDGAECLESGMDDVLPKPVHLHSLFKVLSNWISL